MVERTRAKPPLEPGAERAELRAPIEPARLRALGERIGVSRVARVNGLDRAGSEEGSGVEVACAVRPGGHVLQVSNGKGLDAASARAGALLEAAELWAAEHPDPARLLFASLAELQARGASAWPLEDELLAPELFSPSLRIAWIAARRLDGEHGWHANDWDPNDLAEARVGAGRARARSAARARKKDLPRPVFVPAAAVHCAPASGPWLGPAVHRWTSNGMGAHPTAELALRHALLEAAERDGLARALPDGWTERALRRRKLDPDSLSRAAPRAAALREGLARRGLSAHLFDLNPNSGTGMEIQKMNRARAKPDWMDFALAGALLIDDERGPIALSAGYCCAPGRDAALLGALLEAAQSRLTDIHGAREDIAPAARETTLAFADAVARARPARDANELPAHGELSSAELLTCFAAAGFSRMAALDLAPPGFPARIVKVVAPDLLVSELL